MSLDTICTGNWTEVGRRCFRWAVLPALALLLLGGFARPAQAGDEFEDAFKFELGRIAAHEAVYAGRHVLGALVSGSQPYAHARSQAYPVYVALPQAHAHDRHWRGHGHYRSRGHGHGHGHQRRHHGCGRRHR